MSRQRRHRRVSKKRGNGEGGIYRRKDGRWVGQYTIYTATGPKYRYLYGKTRAVVAEKLTKAMADRDSGLIFDAGKITVGDYLNWWLADSVKGTVRTSTYERHEEIVRLHIKPSLGRVGLKKLTPAHVRGLYSEKLDSGLAPATVRRIHSTLHKALSQAVSDGIVPRNAAHVKAITTGLRRGELLGLRWDDADLELGTLRVGRALVREGGRHTLGHTKTG